MRRPFDPKVRACDWITLQQETLNLTLSYSHIPKRSQCLLSIMAFLLHHQSAHPSSTDDQHPAVSEVTCCLLLLLLFHTVDTGVWTDPLPGAGQRAAGPHPSPGDCYWTEWSGVTPCDWWSVSVCVTALSPLLPGYLHTAVGDRWGLSLLDSDEWTLPDLLLVERNKCFRDQGITVYILGL